MARKRRVFGDCGTYGCVIASHAIRERGKKVRVGFGLAVAARDFGGPFQKLRAPRRDLIGVDGPGQFGRACGTCSPLIAASATFALKAGLLFRRGRLLMVSPVHGIMPISGRNSTYPDCPDSPSHLCCPRSAKLFLVSNAGSGLRRNLPGDRRNHIRLELTRSRDPQIGSGGASELGPASHLEFRKEVTNQIGYFGCVTLQCKMACIEQP